MSDKQIEEQNQRDGKMTLDRQKDRSSSDDCLKDSSKPEQPTGEKSLLSSLETTKSSTECQTTAEPSTTDNSSQNTDHLLQDQDSNQTVNEETESLGDCSSTCKPEMTGNRTEDSQTTQPEKDNKDKSARPLDANVEDSDEDGNLL